MQPEWGGASGGSLARAGRVELESQSEGHHHGPDSAAVASAGTATNLPPSTHQRVPLVPPANARMRPK